MKNEKQNTIKTALPELPINKDLPYIMHIDLNSCFATIEQQANRLLRNKPVGVSAYNTPHGFVIAASYDAKRKGVKLGVNNAQAKMLCPDITILTPDPSKYREAHRLFKAVLLEYSPNVVPKSIDEFILDLEHSPALKRAKLKILNQESHISEEGCKIHNQAMLQIATEIKLKIAESLGEYVTVNIGISTNRFLAKYAAGFDKPDGMTLIDHSNLIEKFTNMNLIDLPGINVRYRARLRIAGIFTPLDFLHADLNKLEKQVFHSINGYHWYRRLRGYEADAVDFSRKSIGHQYALPDKTTDLEKLERLLMKLCEKTGRRLRKSNYYATGIHLYLGFVSDYPAYDGPSSFENMHNIRSWHHGEKVYHRLYSTQDIYLEAKRLLHSAEIPSKVKIMSVHVFGLEPWDPEQLNLFQIEESKLEGQKSKVKTTEFGLRSVDAQKRVSDAVDEVNNRYGEFVITPGLIIEMQGEILDRIAFGQVNEL